MNTRIPLTLLVLALLGGTPAFGQADTDGPHADVMACLVPFEGAYTLDGEAQMEEGTYMGALTVASTLGGRFRA